MKGASASYGGGAGLANGNSELVPLMGGSGGAGGDGWIGSYSNDYAGGGGGGGGGALMLVSWGALDITGAVSADGGVGGLAAYTFSSGGGGGSGGALHLAGRDFSLSGTLSVAGGAGGVSTDSADKGGAGGEGRVRLDGAAPPSFSNGASGSKASTYEGCAIIDVYNAELQTASGDALTYAVYDAVSASVTSGSLARDGLLDLTTTLRAEGGDLFVVIRQGDVLSPLCAIKLGDEDADGLTDDAEPDLF